MYNTKSGTFQTKWLRLEENSTLRRGALAFVWLTEGRRAGTVRRPSDEPGVLGEVGPKRRVWVGRPMPPLAQDPVVPGNLNRVGLREVSPCLGSTI